MTSNSSREVRAITLAAVQRLTYAQKKALTYNAKLADIGFRPTLRKVLPGIVSDTAESSGWLIDEDALARRLKEAETIGDLVKFTRESARVSAKPRGRGPTFSLEWEYTDQEAMRDVCIVIGNFKRINPGRIGASDNLETKWHFDLFEKRALAQSLNLYYQNALQLRLKPLIHPSETGSAATVADVVGIVLRHMGRGG